MAINHYVWIIVWVFMGSFLILLMISDPRIMIAPTSHCLLFFKRFKNDTFLIYKVLHSRHKFTFDTYSHKRESYSVMHRHIETNSLNFMALDLSRSYFSCKSKNIPSKHNNFNLLIT